MLTELLNCVPLPPRKSKTSTPFSHRLRMRTRPRREAPKKQPCNGWSKAYLVDASLLAVPTSQEADLCQSGLSLKRLLLEGVWCNPGVVTRGKDTQYTN